MSHRVHPFIPYNTECLGRLSITHSVVELNDTGV